MKEHERSAAAPRRRPFWKSLLFTIILVTVFFVSLELILALIGVRSILVTEDPFVGFAGNSPLFIEERQPGGAILLKTAPPKIEHFNYQEFPKEKGPKTYRIFCMGESTTVGHPYNDKVSYCGWLRLFLKAADPSRNWEVINAGGVSYASYRIVRLMEELTQYQPDLFIVYVGQNEFLEQRSYGRLMELPHWALRAGGMLSATRTWAAIDRLVDAVRPDPLENAKKHSKLGGEVDEILTHTVGPTSYHRDDSLREQVIKHYRYSMGRMVDIAHSAGAKILFVQPAINLKDMSPFKSEHKEGLSQQALAEWKDLYRRAGELQKQGRSGEALALYRQALGIDDRYAELHYRIGQVLFEMGKYEEAEKTFWRAVDEDIAPLRILSPMKRIVEEVAARSDAPLVDFPRLLKETSLREYKHAVLGKEYFLDHVHTNIKGYRLLGLALFDQLVKQGIAKPDSSWNGAKIEALTKQLVASLNVNDLGEALRILGRTLAWAGKLEEGENALLKALELQGPHLETFNFLVMVSMRQGKYHDAMQYLQNTLVAYPKMLGPRIRLAELLAVQGKTDEAIRYLREELELNPNNDLAHTELAVELVKKRDRESAFLHFNAALKINPDNEHARLLLARLLAQEGRSDEALTHLREVVRINPAQPYGHHDLGVLLRKRGALKEAIPHLIEAVRLKPEDADFKTDLQEARGEDDRAKGK